MGVVKLSNYRPSQETVEQNVAQLEDGYTRLANGLYDQLNLVDLNKNELKVVHAIIRKTYGFNKNTDRISDSQIVEKTNLSRQAVNFAKKSLLRMHVLLMVGSKIGINKAISEWDIRDCHRKSDTVRETMTPLSRFPGHTKDTITKDKKDNTPQPPEGGCIVPTENPVSKSKTPPIDYEAVMSAYNTTLGDRLPQATQLNDKRRRAIKRLMTELNEPTVNAVTKYFSAFASEAKPFYFGNNDRGWRANFDYLLRSDTLLKTREESL